MLQFLCALTAKLLDRDEAKKKQQSFIVTKHSVVEFLYSWKVDFSIRNNIWGLSTKKKNLWCLSNHPWFNIRIEFHLLVCICCLEKGEILKYSWVEYIWRYLYCLLMVVCLQEKNINMHYLIMFLILKKEEKKKTR